MRRRRTLMRVRVSIGLLAIIVLTIGVAGTGGAYQRPGITERVSVASDGTQAEMDLPLSLFSGDELCPGPDSYDISSDGQTVVFAHLAGNLVPNDNNVGCDVFVHDRRTGATELVSVGTDGNQGIVGECLNGPPLDHGSFSPSVSSGGRFVAFSSCAATLVPGDTNGAGDIFVHDRKKGSTFRVSVNSQGQESSPPALANNQDPAISDDGRFVAFVSPADNLVDNDTNGQRDIFVRDLKKETTIRASVTSDGFEARPRFPADSTTSLDPSISADGRFISFQTIAAFVSDDTNEIPDYYVHDLVGGTTERVSVSSDGSQAVDAHQVGLFKSFRGHRSGSRISDNGRYVVFRERAQNLVPNDSGGPTLLQQTNDVFVHDRLSDRTERVSVLPTGQECEGEESFPPGESTLETISGNGRFVAFAAGSGCDEYFPHSGSGFAVVVHDRKTAALHRVSVDPAGSESDSGGQSSYSGAFSHSGQFLAFESDVENLITGDTNELRDVFVRNLGTELGIGGLSRLASSGSLSVDEDGSFATTGSLAELDPTTDLSRAMTDRGANVYGASLSNRPQYQDLFVRIQLEDMPYGNGTSLAGDPSILYGFDLSANGTHYQIRSQRFASDSIEGLTRDELAAGGANFGLFRCDADAFLGCTKVASLKGGYGTTGVEVVVALPLSSIGLEAGGELSGLEAFTAFGSYDLGALNILDTMTLPN